MAYRLDKIEDLRAEVKEALKDPEQAKRRGLDNLNAWMPRQRIHKETLRSRGREQKGQPSADHLLAVAYRRPDNLLHSQTQSEIVTKHDAELSARKLDAPRRSHWTAIDKGATLTYDIDLPLGEWRRKCLSA